MTDPDASATVNTSSRSPQRHSPPIQKIRNFSPRAPLSKKTSRKTHVPVSLTTNQTANQTYNVRITLNFVDPEQEFTFDLPEKARTHYAVEEYLDTIKISFAVMYVLAKTLNDAATNGYITSTGLPSTYAEVGTQTTKLGPSQKKEGGTNAVLYSSPIWVRVNTEHDWHEQQYEALNMLLDMGVEANKGHTELTRDLRWSPTELSGSTAYTHNMKRWILSLLNEFQKLQKATPNKTREEQITALMQQVKLDEDKV